MSFLNPLMLLALAAASIPLLLHLLNLKRGRTVPFSTVRFLKDLQQSRLRMLRFQQILLLILRLGVVVFAVLAFSGPVIGSSGNGAGRSVVIILDNTWSTAVGAEKRPMENRVRDILGRLESADSYTILPLSDPGYPGTDQLHREIEWGERLVESLDTGYGTPGFSTALQVAGRILEGAGGSPEVVIITDRQSSNSEMGEEVSLPSHTRLRLIPLESSDQPEKSVSVDSLRLIARPGGGGYNVTASIRNRGKESAEGVVVDLRPVNGEGDRQRIDIGPGKSRDVNLRGGLADGGTAQGTVSVSGDGIPWDNRRWYTVSIPTSLPVSVIARGDDRATLDRLFALLPSLRPRYLDRDNFRIDDITGRVVVAIDPAGLSEESISTIVRHVREGGGLFLTGGPDMARERGLANRLGLGLGSSMEAGVGSDPFHLTDIAASHPLFEGVFETSSSGRPPSPAVRRLLPSTSGLPLLTLDNGGVLLSDISFGSGRILYLGVPLNLSWSDISTSSLLVPIVLRGVEFLSAGSSGTRNYQVGEEPVISIDQSAEPDQFDVRRPDGSVRRVTSFLAAGGRSIFAGSLTIPGHWFVLQNDDTVARFSVNGDPRESRLEAASVEEIRSRLEGMTGLEVETGDGEGIGGRESARLGLWQYLLIAAIICALAELLVGRNLRGEK